MGTAGTVTVDFAAETAKFTAELKRVNSSLKELQGGFGSLQTFAKDALTFLSAATFASFAKSAFEAASAIGDAAARSGVAVESLSRLKFAAEQNNASFESLTIGVKKLQDNLSNAARGSSEAESAFNSLGLDAAALKGKTLEQQLSTIADRFKLVTSAEDQTRIAADLFGKSGADLIPLLNQGSAGIAALTAEADRLGITLTGSMSAAIDTTDRAVKQLQATLQSLVTKGIGYTVLGVQTTAEWVARQLHGADTVQGRLEDQATDLFSKRRDLVESIARDQEALKSAGATQGRVLQVYIAANQRDLTEIEKQLNVVNEQLLQIEKDSQRLAAAGGQQGSVAADALTEFTPIATKVGVSGAEKAAQANEEISQIIANANRERVEEQIHLRTEANDEDLRLQQQAASEEIRIASETLNFKKELLAEEQAIGQRWIAKQVADAQAAAQARKQVEQSVVSSGIQALNAWNAASTKKSKELVAINKAVSIAQAIQNTYVGATKALAQGGIFGYASAAAIIAFGLAQVAAISKTDYGSSGNSSTASGTSVNPIYTQNSDSDTGYGASTQNAVQVIISGNIGFNDEVLDEIIDGIREAVDGRDVVIFNKQSLQAQVLTS